MNQSFKNIKIAIIRTSSIGDVVLSSACLSMANLLGIKIIWLGRNPTLELLKNAYPEHEYYSFTDHDPRTTVSNLSDQFGKIDGILDLQRNLRSRLFIAQAKKSGFVCKSVEKFQFARISAIAKSWARQRFVVREDQRSDEDCFFQYKAMLSAFSDLLLSLGIDRSLTASAQLKAHPDLSKISENKVEASWINDLSFGQWIALAPGAAHETKQSPESLWIDILKRILSKRDSQNPLGLLLVGGEADRKVSVLIADELSWKGPILNLVGKLTLTETAIALSKTSTLLTNDSGLLHIAEAVGTPVAAAFGPTSEEFGFSPWKKESFVASTPIGCRPCSKHGQVPCRHNDKLCFEAIHALTVSDLILSGPLAKDFSPNPGNV